MADTNDKDQSQINIPITTIARIFRELSFKQQNTRITLNSLELSSQYINLFINEAILRSNEERIAEGDELDKVDGIDGISDNQRQLHQADQDEQELNDYDEYQQQQHEEGDEEDDDTVDDPPETQTQPKRQDDVKLNDVLDSHHLAKVAGLLVLDF
ncbi:CENP-S associating centromere protein X-domain-containing protein [Scheffersomyces coipomensis]|uniref:CENP-S associating centromere protein X-domain-containing protein n=1 Tax=Scheffersomyces coipomensis TaxID=1788519 RepID=UPI00315D617A